MFKQFLASRSGNFGMMTALLLVPLIGVAGLAIDISNALVVRSTLQAAADAAAIAAVAETSAGVTQAMLMQSDGQLSAAIEDAKKVFKGHASMSEDYNLTDFDVDVVKEGNQLKAVFNFHATVPTTLARILGRPDVTVAGQAEAVFQTDTFRDFYLLLDNTPSMGVGATSADVNKMVANTSDKCAFACHIVNNGVENKNSYYYLAKKLGVTIRIDVVAQATAALMDTAKSSRKSSNQYRMAVYTFGEKAEDTKLLEVSSLTDDLDQVQSKASKIGLMSIPWQGYDNDQQTDFDRALKNIGALMGTAGTGSSPAIPRRSFSSCLTVSETPTSPAPVPRPRPEAAVRSQSTRPSAKCSRTRVTESRCSTPPTCRFPPTPGTTSGSSRSRARSRHACNPVRHLASISRSARARGYPTR